MISLYRPQVKHALSATTMPRSMFVICSMSSDEVLPQIAISDGRRIKCNLRQSRLINITCNCRKTLASWSHSALLLIWCCTASGFVFAKRCIDGMRLVSRGHRVSTRKTAEASSSLMLVIRMSFHETSSD
ncbi:hypothetical protein PsorP6_011538 [Peronosclerospora sorghi]|uniref:Uncharacterized protein n=1 Tax=Peronosclerospora sorghi TaxID=230839 RepID=A0ACC0WI13_9STRA|nr:hypothetical protein PsorP6_011538 [Peronosclerospora sorghi]